MKIYKKKPRRISLEKNALNVVNTDLILHFILNQIQYLENEKVLPLIKT